MTNSDFYSRPKEELLVAAKESQKSAQSLFDVAESAAAKKQYGAANSLMILSAEECIKTAILIAGYFNITLPYDIEPFFKDHKAKHEQAAEVQPLINLIATVRSGYIAILSNRKSAYGTFFNMLLVYVFTVLRFQLSHKEGSVLGFDSWWKTANKQKNNGFYVGFFNGKWNFSTDTTQETYAQPLSMVKPFAESVEIVQHLRTGDHLLFSKDREFTKQEIAESGFKLIPTDRVDSEIDLSAYTQINRAPDRSDVANQDL